MQLLLLAAQGTQSSQLVEAFKHNPTFMVMNLCCSAVVLTIVVERFVFQLPDLGEELLGVDAVPGELENEPLDHDREHHGRTAQIHHHEGRVVLERID